jgi:hypothetical protein
MLEVGAHPDPQLPQLNQAGRELSAVPASRRTSMHPLIAQGEVVVVNDRSVRLTDGQPGRADEAARGLPSARGHQAHVAVVGLARQRRQHRRRGVRIVVIGLDPRPGLAKRMPGSAPATSASS